MYLGAGISCWLNFWGIEENNCAIVVFLLTQPKGPKPSESSHIYGKIAYSGRKGACTCEKKDHTNGKEGPHTREECHCC